MSRLGGEIGRFGGVGVLAAIAHYGVLIALVELGGLGATPAALAGYVAGGVVSYVLNYSWTFRSARAHAVAVPRNVAIAALGFGLTGLLMALLHDRWGAPYLLAQLATTGVVMAWSFVANRAVTFGRPSA